MLPREMRLNLLIRAMLADRATNQGHQMALDDLILAERASVQGLPMPVVSAVKGKNSRVFIELMTRDKWREPE